MKIKKGNWQGLFLIKCHVFTSSKNDLNMASPLAIKQQHFLRNWLPGESSGIQQQGYSPTDGTCIICYSLSVTVPEKGINICSEKKSVLHHVATHITGLQSIIAIKSHVMELILETILPWDIKRNLNQ